MCAADPCEQIIIKVIIVIVIIVIVIIIVIGASERTLAHTPGLRVRHREVRARAPVYVRAVQAACAQAYAPLYPRACPDAFCVRALSSRPATTVVRSLCAKPKDGTSISASTSTCTY